jgi:hypothetical protein
LKEDEILSPTTLESKLPSTPKTINQKLPIEKEFVRPMITKPIDQKLEYKYPNHLFVPLTNALVVEQSFTHLPMDLLMIW